jgi:hypothetical protein
MKPTDVLDTISWIRTQVPVETIRHLLYPEEKNMGARIKASFDFARVQNLLSHHPHAPAVLEAFELQGVLHDDFPADLLSGPPGANRDPVIRKLWSSWTDMLAAEEAFRKLIVPAENEAEIVRFELHEDGDAISADRVLTLLKSVKTLYEVFSKALGVSNQGSLTIRYMASGSDFRIDFSGLDAPINAIKTLVVEAWLRSRHRKYEDAFARNGAILDGLKVLNEITNARQDGVISEEDKRQLKQKVVGATLDLFKSGAFPQQVPDVEQVKNRELLAEFQQHLLPAPKQIAQADAAGQKPKKKGRAGAMTSDSEKPSSTDQ